MNLALTVHGALMIYDRLRNWSRSHTVCTLVVDDECQELVEIWGHQNVVGQVLMNARGNGTDPETVDAIAAALATKE